MFSKYFFAFVCILSAINMRTMADRGSSLGCYRQNLYLHRIDGLAGSADSCITDCEHAYFRYAVLDRHQCLCTNRIKDDEITADECDFPCNENDEQICGGSYAQSYYDTDIHVAGPPRQVEITNRSSSSILLRWQHFDPLVLQSDDSTLSRYLIRAKVVKSFSSISIPPPPQWMVEKRSDSQIELVNLHPGTKYNITITSESENNGEGGTSYILAETEIGIPDPEPPEPKIVNKEGSTMLIEIPPLININGPITYVHVIVVFVDSEISQRFDESLLKSFNEAQEDGTDYYIAAELTNQNETQQFTIGDGRNYGSYANTPLPSDRHVHVALGIVSKNGDIIQKRYAVETSHGQHGEGSPTKIYDDGTNEGINGFAIFLIILCVLFSILLTLSIIAYIYLRLRHEKRIRQLPSEHHELTSQAPMVEVENNGAYQPDEFAKRSFQQQLDEMIAQVDSSKQFPRNTLSLDVNSIIATGQFGDVIKGKLNGESCQVHVISEDMEPLDQSQFLQEFGAIKRLSKHHQILNFYGICQTADWLYLLFEDASITLKKVLVESRTPPNVNPQRFTAFSEQKILSIVGDIGAAMEYLANENFIHKRLCSYNVRITANDNIKISCFGATPTDNNGKSIDLSRWSAPEVLRFQHYNDRSAIWSFACVAWECCSLGGTLYANISSNDLAARIKAGARPEIIPFVSEDIQQLLMNCWQLEPSERPTFNDINQTLKQLMTAPMHVISFTRREGLLLPYYLPLLEVQT